MLRGTAESITPALTTLFNLSLKSCQIPVDWKISNITPIHKSGDHSNVSNYRPISLLSLVSKVLKRCVHSRVMDFLFANKLLSDCQFGFRPKASTQDALLTVSKDWHYYLTTHRQVGAVFFDVKKAFDSVPHDELLKSLQNIGITGPLLRWFADYLTSRRQRVVLDGFSSDCSHVTSGVPQGSILGPLLFIIFMNSICHVPLSPDCKLILYADDILLYKPLNSSSDVELLQSDAESILEWITSHGLSPNHSKTQLLLISRSKRAPKISLTLSEHTISPSTSVKYLGITITSDLSWSQHVGITCSAAKRQLGLIHRRLHHAPTSVRRKIFTSVVLPKLEYCCAVWDPHLKKDISALESVQKFAGRVITHHWSTNIESLRSALGWKSLESRRRCTKLKVTYNILNNLSCIPQSSFTYHPSPSPRNPHNKTLFKPYVPTQSYKHSFLLTSSLTGTAYRHILSTAVTISLSNLN